MYLKGASWAAMETFGSIYYVCVCACACEIVHVKVFYIAHEYCKVIFLYFWTKLNFF